MRDGPTDLQFAVLYFETGRVLGSTFKMKINTFCARDVYCCVLFVGDIKVNLLLGIVLFLCCFGT